MKTRNEEEKVCEENSEYKPRKLIFSIFGSMFVYVFKQIILIPVTLVFIALAIVVVYGGVTLFFLTLIGIPLALLFYAVFLLAKYVALGFWGRCLYCYKSAIRQMS